MKAAGAFLAKLTKLDAVLVAAGFPAMSPWWRAQVERFIRSGRRRWLLRVGRRGGKSTTLCRLAVAWSLYGSWSVPLGDTAVIAFVSIDRDEAAARLRTIASILTVLGVPFEQRGDELELPGKRVVFRVVTCSVRGTVGFTSVAVFGDEVSRWESRETSSNPAAEVIGSLAPTLATQPDGFMVLSSSPWSLDDFHAVEFAKGDTEHQLTSFAPTWEANPTLSEERTHELEPDNKRWLREYGAVPSASVSAALDGDAISRAQRYLPPGLRLMQPVVCLDFSSGRGDAVVWSKVVWGRQDETPALVSERRYLPGHGFYWEPLLDADGRPTPNPDFEPRPPLLVVGPIQHQLGTFWHSLPSTQLVARIANDAKAWGASTVIGDASNAYGLEGMFAVQGLRFITVPWTQPNKAAAVTRIKRWMRDGQLCLPMPSEGAAAERLDRELRAYEERLSPSGVAIYNGARGMHDDHVAACVMMPAIADALNLLPASPTAPRSRRDMTSIRQFLGDGRPERRSGF
jgi:hypothetical protein